MNGLIQSHLQRYPLSEPQDLIKLIYQNEFGEENLSNALLPLTEQLKTDLINAPLPFCGELFESIGGELSRIHLGLSKLTAETLARIIILSTERHHGTVESFDNKSKELLLTYPDCKFPISEICEALRTFVYGGYRNVEHSSVYRSAYKPCYKVIRNRYIAPMPLIEAIDRRLNEGKATVVAIDGKCCSGKSTLADIIDEIFGATVIRTDDYFIPSILRSPGRLSNQAGRVDCDRFISDITMPLKFGLPVSLSCYDHVSDAYVGLRYYPHTSLTVVEGSYCRHNGFCEPYDLLVFTDVDPDTQYNRVAQRNGSCTAEKCMRHWALSEDRYFYSQKTVEKSDFIIKL